MKLVIRSTYCGALTVLGALVLGITGCELEQGTESADAESEAVASILADDQDDQEGPTQTDSLALVDDASADPVDPDASPPAPDPTPAPDPATVPGTYEHGMAAVKADYGKSDEWEAWMVANKSRYAATFTQSKGKPNTTTVSFRYESDPIAYSPAWTSEAQHMSVLETMAEGAFPGYNFNIVFEGDTGSSYANIIAGTAGSTSYAWGKNVYLYYETIFNHEFGHVMQLRHHYDSMSQVGDGNHMPPGDSKCIMDRNSYLFCSACSAALGIPLNVSGTAALEAAMDDILSRYP